MKIPLTALALAIAAAVAPGAGAQSCEAQLNHCEQQALNKYNVCINNPASPPNDCESIYNWDMDQCVVAYYVCLDEHAMCSPCSSPYYTTNIAYCGGIPEWDHCNCCLREESPIVIDLAGNGVRFSSAEEGALFSINNGPRRRVAWTVGPDDAWLALDRDGNGLISRGAELFGTVTPSQSGERFPNGYEALRELDFNGDRTIDAKDPHYPWLRLWRDENRNGLSEPSELVTLSAAGVAAIDLDYFESRRVDEWGNRFRYRSRVRMKDGRFRRSYDVWPVSLPHEVPAR
jgi:hypothetical protein